MCTCTDFLSRNSNYTTHSKWPLCPADLWLGTKVILPRWHNCNITAAKTCIYSWPSTNSMRMYDNMQYVLHSSEVPVTLYSVSIKTERNVVYWLFMIYFSCIFRRTNTGDSMKSRDLLWNPEIHFEIQNSNLKSEIHLKSSGFRNLILWDAMWQTPCGCPPSVNTAGEKAKGCRKLWKPSSWAW